MRRVCLLCLLFGPAWTPAVFAQEPPDDGGAAEAARGEAHQHFDLGRALMENENWEAALLEFTHSLELFPTRSALFNIGMCQKALHRYVLSLATFERWLAEHTGAASAEELERVQAAVAELRSFVGELVVTAEPAGARIALDGEPVGVAPLERPVLVEVGTHTVEIVADGHRGVLRQVSVLSRQQVEVQVSLEPEAEEAVEPVAVAVEPDVEGPALEVDSAGLSSAWFWTTAAAAAAAGLGGALTGGMALARDADFADAVDRCQAGDPSACADGRSIAAECDDWELATNVLLPAAGALAAAALALAFFTEFGGDGAEQPPVTVLAGPAGGVSGVDGATLGLRLRF